MASPPEPLERWLPEYWDFRAELSRHGIFNGHVRPVAPGSAQSLPGQKCLRDHPVSVVRRDIGTVYVATRQRRGSSSLKPHCGPCDKSLCQRSEIFCFKVLQTVTVDKELNGLSPLAQLASSSPPPIRMSLLRTGSGVAESDASSGWSGMSYNRQDT
jgi:hypothetical protein